MTTATTSPTDVPTRLRTQPARGGKLRVDRDAGIIRGIAVITRGEALGHDLWIDSDFLSEVADAGKDAKAGVKARFTHPGLSADGLGSFLGRAKDLRLDSDIVRGDLHLSDTAYDTPKGDLATYVMDMAEMEPDMFGSSIVFYEDIGAESRHRAEHEDEDGNFGSPDEDNVSNFPHARLAQLRAVDMVDSPGANPEGLFHRDDIHSEAEALAEYALGLSDRKPQTVHFGLDGDRVRPFVARFLETHGLRITPMSKDKRNDDDREVVAATIASGADVAAIATVNAPLEFLDSPGLESLLSAQVPIAAEALRHEGVEAERKRIAAIAETCKTDTEFALKAITEGMSPSDARLAFLEQQNEKLSAQVAELGKAREPDGGEDDGAEPIRFDGGKPEGGEQSLGFMQAAKRLAAEKKIPMHQAMSKIAAKQPDLHRAYVANAHREAEQKAG